ncbi:hypothetical protein VCRA2133E348_40109 [Vibrio crassostreae]|nr:hypothetical protein VCRA2133E348_40109 [Vibrio crassostreae]
MKFISKIIHLSYLELNAVKTTTLDINHTSGSLKIVKVMI